MGNDSDADEDAITAVLDTGPTHSVSFSLNADGSFAYQSSQNYCGDDSFTYHAIDGSLDSNVRNNFV